MDRVSHAHAQKSGYAVVWVQIVVVVTMTLWQYNSLIVQRVFRSVYRICQRRIFHYRRKYNKAYSCMFMRLFEICFVLQHQCGGNDDEVKPFVVRMPFILHIVGFLVEKIPIGKTIV